MVNVEIDHVCKVVLWRIENVYRFILFWAEILHSDNQLSSSSNIKRNFGQKYKSCVHGVIITQVLQISHVLETENNGDLIFVLHDLYKAVDH